MKSVSRLVVLAFGAIFLTSCLQSSTVIRVEKDGSGAIFARYFFSPQMTAMLGGLAGGGLGALGGGDAAAGAPDINPQEIFKPTKETLEKDAASYGEGVRFSKHEEIKNAQGWEGFLVVYEFDDISKVKFDPNNPPGPLKELEKMDPDAAAKARENISEDSTVSFAMEDGLLTINTGVSKESISKIAESGGIEDLTGANGEIPPEAAAQMQMAAGMMQGARMAAFIRVDGAIAETNARHVNGTLITLSDVEMAKMMADPKFMEFLKLAVTAGEAPDDAAIQKMIESLDAVNGVSMETQEKITVKIE